MIDAIKNWWNRITGKSVKAPIAIKATSSTSTPPRTISRVTETATRPSASGFSADSEGNLTPLSSADRTFIAISEGATYSGTVLPSGTKVPSDANYTSDGKRLVKGSRATPNVIRTSAPRREPVAATRSRTEVSPRRTGYTSYPNMPSVPPTRQRDVLIVEDEPIISPVIVVEDPIYAPPIVVEETVYVNDTPAYQPVVDTYVPTPAYDPTPSYQEPVQSSYSEPSTPSYSEPATSHSSWGGNDTSSSYSNDSSSSSYGSSSSGSSYDSGSSSSSYDSGSSSSSYDSGSSSSYDSGSSSSDSGGW